MLSETGDSGSTFCPKGTDLIPEDIKPGDVVSMTGTYTEFGPTAANCGAATPPVTPPIPAVMRQLGNVCVFTKTGTGTVPAPAVVLPTDLDSGSANVAKWEGGLVQINAAVASSSTKSGDTSFGNFTITGSKLAVGDKIYYRGAATAPTVNTGDTFTSIVGMSYLDFCTWAIEPRTCADMTPTTGGSKCGGTTTTDGGTTD